MALHLSDSLRLAHLLQIKQLLQASANLIDRPRDAFLIHQVLDRAARSGLFGRASLGIGNSNGSGHVLGSDSGIDIVDRFGRCGSRVDGCLSLRLRCNKLVGCARDASFRRGHARGGGVTQTWRGVSHRESGGVTALQDGATGHGEALRGAVELGEVLERFG